MKKLCNNKIVILNEESEQNSLSSEDIINALLVLTEIDDGDQKLYKILKDRLNIIERNEAGFFMHPYMRETDITKIMFKVNSVCN